MPRPMAVHAMRLLMVALTALCPVMLPGQAPVLRPLDSGRVRERDNMARALVASDGGLPVGPWCGPVRVTRVGEMPA